MVSIYSVDSNALIEKVAEELKKSDLVSPTEWSKFVKTGISRERPPVNDDWWYFRAASILRSVFKLGPIGVSKLRTKYGGKQDRGVRPERFKDASGNIIRTILQQLEKEGLVMQNKNDKRKGRVIAPKGQSLLEKSASAIALQNINKKNDNQKSAASEKEVGKVPKKEINKESENKDSIEALDKKSNDEKVEN